MSDWINDTMRKPAITAVSAILAVAAMGGHIPSLLSASEAMKPEDVREVVRTEIQEDRKRLNAGLADFIHGIDTQHRDCLTVLKSSGATLVDSEIVCSLRSLEEISIRGLQQ